MGNGVPIEAAGIQGHLLAEDFHTRFHETAYRQFLQELQDRGLRILITEMDVLDDGLPKAPRIRDRKVADVYRHFLTSRSTSGPSKWSSPLASATDTPGCKRTIHARTALPDGRWHSIVVCSRRLPTTPSVRASAMLRIAECCGSSTSSEHRIGQ
jgi:hypothetical protein